MPEFDLIDSVVSRIRRADQAFADNCVLDIGDDAAVLEVPAGFQLVICTDSLNEGVHFPVGTPAAAVGHKVLAANLSDLAAMGARPAWYFLALSLPEQDDDWVAEFAEGQAELAARAGICLAGGDTTRGPLSITVTAVGLVEKGEFMAREGARPGDRVIVSGYPGRAATALSKLQAHGQPDAEHLRALQFPEPRLSLGRSIRHHATACIDVSDGLLADLGHILVRSGVGAVIETADLTASGELSIDAILGGGDDYELCFCMPPDQLHLLPDWSATLGLPLTVIGTIRAEPGLLVRGPSGDEQSPEKMGYQHFTENNADPDNAE